MISHTLPQNGQACNSAPAASAESSPAELPPFSELDALGLSFDHDVGNLVDALNNYLKNLRLALGHDVILSTANPDYPRANVRRVALETAARAVESLQCAAIIATSAARQAAAADRFVEHVEKEYRADKELAAARRKRRRVARPSSK